MQLNILESILAFSHFWLTIWNKGKGKENPFRYYSKTGANSLNNQLSFNVYSKQLTCFAFKIIKLPFSTVNFWGFFGSTWNWSAVDFRGCEILEMSYQFTERQTESNLWTEIHQNFTISRYQMVGIVQSNHWTSKHWRTATKSWRLWVQIPSISSFKGPFLLCSLLNYMFTWLSLMKNFIIFIWSGMLLKRNWIAENFLSWLPSAEFFKLCHLGRQAGGQAVSLCYQKVCPALQSTKSGELSALSKHSKELGDKHKQVSCKSRCSRKQAIYE